MRKFRCNGSCASRGSRASPVTQDKEQQYHPSQQQANRHQPRQQRKTLPLWGPDNLIPIAGLEILNHGLVRHAGLQLLANNTPHLLRNSRLGIGNRLALADGALQLGSDMLHALIKRLLWWVLQKDRIPDRSHDRHDGQPYKQWTPLLHTTISLSYCPTVSSPARTFEAGGPSGPCTHGLQGTSLLPGIPSRPSTG